MLWERNPPLTETDPDHHDIYSETAQILTATAIYLLDISLITGNILVIVAFLNDRQLQITRNYYIFNLAVADLVIGVLVIPIYSSTIWMNDWVLSRQFCVVWIIVNQTAVLNSHAAIFLITYDRYKLVQNAMHYTATETPEKASRRIILIWIISSLFNTAFVIFGEWYYARNSDLPSCSPHTPVEVPYFVGLKIYDIIVTSCATTLMVFFPLAALIILNKKVYSLVRKRVRKTSALNTLINKSLPPAHFIANVNMANNLPKSPTTPVLNVPGNGNVEKWPQSGRAGPLRSVGSISQAPTLETIQEEQDRELQQMRAKVVQWLDEIPTDEVFALSNAYLEEISASTSQDNTDSGANGTHETEVYDSDSIFEVRSPNLKPTAEGLRLSVSSLSSISSLQLGEEAGSSNADDAQENTLQVRGFERSKSKSPRKTSKRTKSTSSGHLKEPTIRNVTKTPIQNISRRTQIHSMPTISKVVPPVPPIVNPQKIVQPCPMRRGRKNSANSVAILAKYKLKQDRKAGFTITLLIALFVLFKVPYAIALLGNAFRGEYWLTVQSYEAVTWLYWIKSVTNPFVYAFISKRFRLYCRKLFERTRTLCCRTMYTLH